MSKESMRELYEKGVAKAAKQKGCGQYGGTWEDPACGPSHAIVAGKCAD